MLQGRLIYDPAIAEQFKGIPWKKINKEYKNDYDLAAASVLQTMQDPQRLQESAEQIIKQCEQLDLNYKRKLNKAKWASGETLTLLF